MYINYLEDDDFVFLFECSEVYLEVFICILIYGENGKFCFFSMFLCNEIFLVMEGYLECYCCNWQLIVGELQYFGGDSIVNMLCCYGKFYCVILLDVCK